MKEAIREAIKELILPEFDAVKGELRELRGRYEEISVRISDLNNHVIELGRRVDAVREELNARIDETNKRIDAVREELNARIDETNKRIDGIYVRLEENTKEIGNLKAEIAELKTRQEIMNDVIRRLGKLEEKVFA